MANTEVERHTGVDVEDVPSAPWGWSKENPRLIHLGGIIAGLFLLAMLHPGNGITGMEASFLLAFAVVVFGVVARDWWLRRHRWSR